MFPALNGSFGDLPDAVTISDRSMSWSALQSAAEARAREVGGARAAAVVARADVETVISVLAGLQTGVPIVPVPPDSGTDEREHILRDSGAALLLDGDKITTLARSTAPAPAAAMILYTSGTTGAPKGVLIGAEAIVTDLDLLAQAWQWNPDDVLVHGLPLFHVHGLILGVLGALRVGSRLIHTSRPTPEAYARAGGSLYFGVPTVWARICAAPGTATALRSARLLVSGSAPLPVPVFDRLTELTGHRPVERYGMTESLIVASTRADGPRAPGVVGPALPGITSRIVGEDSIEMPRDGVSVGELQLRSPTLFGGYLGRPEATADCYTSEGWFRTGDVATIDAEGVHRIVGRASTDLIKSGGYRIGAGEVEHALLGHPAVSEAAVVGVPDDDLGQRIVAHVVADQVTEKELMEHVASRLSVHKRPRQVVLVDDLPRNAMGKVQKQQLLPGR